MDKCHSLHSSLHCLYLTKGQRKEIFSVSFFVTEPFVPVLLFLALQLKWSPVTGGVRSSLYLSGCQKGLPLWTLYPLQCFQRDLRSKPTWKKCRSHRVCPAPREMHSLVWPIHPVTAQAGLELIPGCPPEVQRVFPPGGIWAGRTQEASCVCPRWFHNDVLLVKSTAETFSWLFSSHNSNSTFSFLKTYPTLSVTTLQWHSNQYMQTQRRLKGVSSSQAPYQQKQG